MARLSMIDRMNTIRGIDIKFLPFIVTFHIAIALRIVHLAERFFRRRVAVLEPVQDFPACLRLARTWKMCWIDVEARPRDHLRDLAGRFGRCNASSPKVIDFS